MKKTLNILLFLSVPFFFIFSGFKILEINKVLPEEESISLPGIVINTYIILSDRYRQVDINEVKSITKKIEVLSEYFKDSDYKAKLNAIKGSYNLIIGFDNLGLKYLYDAKKLANDSGNQHLLSRICISIGFYFLNNGEYYKAMTEFEESNKYAIKNNDLYAKFISTIYLGEVYRHIEEYNIAIDYYGKTLDFIPSNRYNSYYCNLKFYWGFCYFSMKEFDKAFNEFEEVFEVAKKLKIVDIQGHILSRKADYYLDVKGDLDTAYIYYSKAYRIFTDNLILNHASTIATKMSNVWMRRNNYIEALTLDKIALNFRKRVNVKFSVSSSYTNIGNVYFKNGYLDEAEKYFKKGLKELEGLNMKSQFVYTYDRLYNLFSKTGDSKKAFNYYKLFREYSDTVNINKASVELSRYKMKYDIGKKNADLKEIELQRQNEKVLLLTFSTILISIAVVLTYRAYRSKMKINKELENLSANQEKTIQDRTKDLENEIVIRKATETKLNEALEKEKHLSELKGRFVSIVSHEFRTPLAGIVTSIEILLNSFVNKRFEWNKVKYFDRIKSNIDRITKLMDDVLILGKKDSGKLIFTPELIDIAAFIEELRDSNYKTADGNKLFNIHIKGEHHKVMIDNNMMYHILNNLLSNAVKFSRNKKKPDITINYLENGLELIVKDYGIGIPENEIPNLFQSFTRASNASGIEGSGLGLVIIKQLVESHNGKVTMESKLNSGSTFTIFIPQ